MLGRMGSFGRIALASAAAIAAAAASATVVSLIAAVAAHPMNARMMIGGPASAILLYPFFLIGTALFAIPVMLIGGLPAHFLLRYFRRNAVAAYAGAGAVIALILLARDESAHAVPDFPGLGWMIFAACMAGAVAFRLVIGPAPAYKPEHGAEHLRS